ncbi:MAG: zinc ribbon domain-containing protein [Solobacterium sp.]|nr:zinc ribbon domain-containing protein [Solobacterium sp.]
MYCASCGAQMPDGAKFCQKCGAKMIQPAAPAQQSPQPQSPNVYTNQQAPQQAPNAYTQPSQKTTYVNRQTTANNVYAKAGKKAAAKAGKAGLGLGAKLAIGAAAVGLGVAAVSGMFDDGGGGEGGGTYQPPIVQQQGGSNTSGNNSGGNVSTSQGLSDGEYFIWESYSPESEGIEAILIRIGSDGVAYYVYDDGSEEEMFAMSGSPSSGSLSLNVSEEEGTGSISLKKNSDGSFSGMMSTSTDEGYANLYNKMVPVRYAGGEYWTIPSTGETVTYDQITRDELAGTSVAQQFLKESASAGNTFVEYNNKPTTSNPTFSTPLPSNGGNTAVVPDEVMRTYVTYEVENIEHEYNGVSVPNHIKMPNASEQKRFEALIQEELYGERLDFWLANKDEWYK